MTLHCCRRAPGLHVRVYHFPAPAAERGVRLTTVRVRRFAV